MGTGCCGIDIGQVEAVNERRKGEYAADESEVVSEDDRPKGCGQDDIEELAVVHLGRGVVSLGVEGELEVHGESWGLLTTN